MTTCPDIKTAVRLWVKSIDVMSEWILGQYLREYIYHTETIAENAAKIASRCHLDEQKAYVLGLLHDYGKKTNQKISGKSHFMTGYDELSAMGWSDVARINLTHSFPEKDFDYSSCLDSRLFMLHNISPASYQRRAFWLLDRLRRRSLFSRRRHRTGPLSNLHPRRASVFGDFSFKQWLYLGSIL